MFRLDSLYLLEIQVLLGFWLLVLADADIIRLFFFVWVAPITEIPSVH
jgi:hypothetical protein